MTPRRVVITGLGAITPIGNTVRDFWAAALAGTNGIGPITKFDASVYPTRIAGEVRDFDYSEWIEKKEANRTDLFVQYAITASGMALRDSGLELEREDTARIGVIIGSGIGGIATLEKQHRILLEKGPSRVSPFMVPMMIVDMAAGMTSIRFGLRGPNYACVSACSSGAHAIGDAFTMIREGKADVMVSGGAEATITPLCVAGFCAARAFSTRNDEPELASRPFDAKRDGFVMGEGCGILILEELDRAKARGARIYAELVGYGASADAYHLTASHPEGEGAARSMVMALKDADARLEDVDYINAHGTSTPLGDVSETKAVKAVFGEHARRIKMSSTKSMIGHLLGAAGAVEAVITTLSVHEGMVHPTRNLVNFDPECDLDYVPGTAQKMAVGLALSNSFGFGGHNASLAFRRYEE